MASTVSSGSRCIRLAISDGSLRGQQAHIASYESVGSLYEPVHPVAGSDQ
jgi:hypothetical protein